ncbi:MAG TPA: methyltransferase domain-containing protein [Bryobacteraceae bacterium]|nr:methyltransferase domain-containing protein [Bryobacteraceae bacterium]HOQ43732.1 methyltransferase domain-containing protein [Bryobacteraceae bacterium]HPQ14130.1 methyltransferase domain-containing protein [Bryobacteraceae bacterium]HPU71825.1 methyltransferase domain-containing protein [Bryobacteraceae bacterium]
MTYPWQFDESVQRGTDYGDEGNVTAYDELMLRLRDVEREAAEIAEAISLSPDAVIWEIGTGTGECALRLARCCRHVFATDVSAPMLACARRKADERKIANVTFEIGGFRSGFQPDGQLDAVISQLALHHLPDFWKFQALGAISRRLRPHGRLYLRDVVFPSPIDDYDAFINAAIQELRLSAGEEIATQAVRHFKEEFSTLDWILEGMMERNGLRILRKSRSGILTAYTCESAGMPFSSAAASFAK